MIEENGRAPGLNFGMWGYLWPGSDNLESWNVFHTFDEVMTCMSHFGKCEKSHKCFYITPTRDRKSKT